MANSERILNRGNFLQRHAKEIVLATGIGFSGLGVAGVAASVLNIDSIRKEQKALINSPTGSFSEVRQREIILEGKIRHEIFIYSAAGGTLVAALGFAYAYKTRREQE